MDYLAALNRQFAISGQLVFEAGAGGLIFARITNPRARAEIALQGAHVCRFQPAGQAELFWLSPNAQFAPGKAIRGGIPICWPWFSAHPEQPDLPAHGFARTAQWQMAAAETLADGATRLAFSLDTARMQTLWPHPCMLQYRVTVGERLAVELVTENAGATAFEFTEALHAYFSVSHAAAVSVAGLDGCQYVDKADGGAVKTQQGDILIRGETDRVYPGACSECRIGDAGMERHIRIAKQGSRSTIVWNPGPQRAAQMADIGAGNERAMLCVESGNVLQDAVRLEPGQRHVLAAEYGALPWSGACT